MKPSTPDSAEVNYSRTEKKRGALILWASILLTVLTVALTLWFTGPPPPKEITIATGSAGGAYDNYGKQYKEKLEKMGLQVTLVNTNGGMDNLQRLVRREVDVAFTQGGLVKEVSDPKGSLRGLAALYLEPVWVFSHTTAGLNSLSDLKGRTVSVGAVNSGTEAVARALLDAHGVLADKSKRVNLPPAAAEAALIKGEVEAIIIVSSPANEVVQRLLARSDISLMDFARQDMAHTRLFPYLRVVKVYAGLFDLEHNIPATDKTLLAPEAVLVARSDLHAQVVEELYDVMNSLHSSGDLLSAPNTFPTIEGVDMPLHDAAEAYARSGGSFLNRNLPYWAVRWVWRLRILLLPLLAVWIPALKFLPQFYRLWSLRLLKRCYRQLRDTENAIHHASTPEALRQSLSRLDALRSTVWGRAHRIPSFLQPDIYQWRTHVAEVYAKGEERLKRLDPAATSSPPTGPEA